MTGLVLEGGGMRGVFTTGVLDYLHDAEIKIDYTVAVSAGAGHGLSLKSGQRGRAKKSCIDMLSKHNYIGMRQLWHSRSIINQKIVYDLIPNKILPFDFEACFANPMRYEIVTTNCLTGQAEYLTEDHDKKRLLKLCKASGSLPFVCPVCTVDGIPMLDGGIADPIPVDRAFRQGCDRVIVVLTRNANYRDSMPNLKYPSMLYREYPRLRVALNHMAETYNACLDRITQLEQEGRALVIRPERPLTVTRMETNLTKLYALYDEAYDIAMDKLKQWKGKEPVW